MDKKEEQEIERKVKKEKKAGVDAESLYAGVTNGIPNERDNGGNFDALNATLAGGSHPTNINTQTNLELGGVADPNGIDPAMDRQYLENMKKNLKKNQ